MIAKEKSPKGIKRSILVKLPFLLLIPLGLWLPSLASMHPLTVERLYSRGIYPYISRALGGFTSLLGFSGNLYGKFLRLELLFQVRPEQKFSSLSELTAQIARDQQTVLHRLSGV